MDREATRRVGRLLDKALSTTSQPEALALLEKAYAILARVINAAEAELPASAGERRRERRLLKDRRANRRQPPPGEPSAATRRAAPGAAAAYREAAAPPPPRDVDFKG